MSPKLNHLTDTMLSKAHASMRFGLRHSGALRKTLNISQLAPTISYVRFNSTSTEGSNLGSNISNVVVPSLDDRIVDTSTASDALLTASAGIENAANEIIASAPQLGYNPVDLVISTIEQVHVLSGMPYWQSIVAVTIGIRFALLPIALKGVQNANRMAFLKPDMEKVQNAMKASTGDAKMQARYQLEIKELFKKHNVNPFRALLMPLLQMPIFISLFMALRQMQDYCPGYTTGGVLWFTDLSIADPTYMLPIINALSFLLMVEVGADGMDQANRGMFKNVMRGLSIFMVPLTASMPQVSFS